MLEAVVQVSWKEASAQKVAEFQHLGGAFEDGNGRRRLRQHCIGFEQMMSSHSAPCRCSGFDKGSYVWHHYKPLKEKLADIIESIVREYEDWESVIVSAAHSVDRFIKLRGVPICRDQFLRLVTAALCVNAKYWDEGAAQVCQNSRIANRAKIPLDDFNRMEIHFMSGLGWNVSMSREEYDCWLARLHAEAVGASCGSELAQLPSGSSSELEQLPELHCRKCSPLLSTDVFERLASQGNAAGGEVAAEILRVSSSAKDSSGNYITSRLVFPALPVMDPSEPSFGSMRRCNGGHDTILRICNSSEEEAVTLSSFKSSLNVEALPEC